MTDPMTRARAWSQKQREGFARADAMARAGQMEAVEAVRGVIGRVAPKLSLWERGAVARAPKLGGALKVALRGPISPEPPARVVRLGPVGSGADIEFKPEARLDGLVPEMTRIYPDVAESWRRHGGPRPVITSGNDGQEHRRDSRHYTNQALDFRGNNVDRERAARIRGELETRLGPDYDVLYQTYPKNRRRNHFHIEHHPKALPGDQ